MRPFEFASPKTQKEVPTLLGHGWGEVEVLAGGTDLLSLMKDEITAPKRLVNIKKIPDLHFIESVNGKTRIGALVTLAEIAASPNVQHEYPALAAAAGDAASPQIRNLATLGGNLCQRPRCWYFRTGHGLLARDAEGKSLVLAGDNRYHAILGNDGPAYFVSPSTVAPVLVAYQATATILGPKGTRTVPLEKFFVAPKNDQEREHDLRPDELVTEIGLPANPPAKVASYEVRQKEAFDWPYATATAALVIKSGIVESARIVLGHVAPMPWVSPEAASEMFGKTVTPEHAERAAQAALARAKSLGHNEQKIHLARVAVKRAILKAGGVA
ncbi:MAG: FAD binding domain-containing protein [Acidobacteriia bacterium]|nr:FAD binding domain-containing protein [Terriglobia bacterium]